MLVAIGERTQELGGRCMDGVILHTYMTDEATSTAVAAVRRGAEQAGRDPDAIRIWSVLATVGDHIDDDLRLKKTVGRLATYLQGYGDLLVRVNGWDPEVLARFRADEFVQSFRGGLDAKATTAELEHVATLIPAEWLAASATGSSEQCAAAINHQIDLGVQRRDPPRGDARRAGADPARLLGHPVRAVRRRASEPRPPDPVTLLIDTAEEITPEWFAGVLGAAGLDVTVPATTVERVGTGQIGASYRVTPTYASAPARAPSTLVVKLGAGDAAMRSRVSPGLPQRGRLLPRHRRHGRHRHAALLARRGVRRRDRVHARCSTTCTLRSPGVQADGCTVDAGGGRRWSTSPGSTGRAGTTRRCSISSSCRRSTPDTRRVRRRDLRRRRRAVRRPLPRPTRRRRRGDHRATSADALATWQMARPEPFAVVHGDYRLDNLMFSAGRAGHGARLADRVGRPAGAGRRLLPRHQPGARTAPDARARAARRLPGARSSHGVA